MTIKVTCTECRATYELPDAMAGQTGECECGATFVIPLASEGYASLDNGASAVNVNEDNDEPQNAFAAPQVAEVSELQLADFTDSDKAGLMRLMTGLKLIAWIPGVALIGVAVSFVVGLMSAVVMALERLFIWSGQLRLSQESLYSWVIYFWQCRQVSRAPDRISMRRSGSPFFLIQVLRLLWMKYSEILGMRDYIWLEVSLSRFAVP